jgi:pyruvate,water dikinase
MLDRRIEAFLPRMQAFYRATPINRAGQLSDAELLAEIERLYTATQETARYNIVVPLLMQIYNRLLRSQLSRRGLDYGRLDLTAGLTGWKELDPAAQIDDLRRAAATLTPAQRASLSADGDWAGTDDEDLVRLRQALDDFLERFGHLSDSGNDFSSVPWREQPDLVSRLVLADIVPTADHEAKLRFSELPLSPLQRGLLGPLYRRACRYRLYREQVSSLYTYGYGLFRVFFLEIGERLVRRQGLRTRDDVFLLTIDELRAALRAALDDLNELTDLAVSRRQEMEAARDILPPETLYGDKPVPINNAPGRVLHGTPTSRGYYVGRACAVRGLGDFGKLQPGDVLVIPFSDVGWTPLFAMAGAVVAESGGMLSHSSIVAREYGLPAVVSVFEACQRLDGLQVTVDGYRGEVWLPDNPEPSENPGKEA